MTDQPHPDLKAIRNELEQEFERRGWAFWPLTVEAQIIEDKYSVTLTRAGGTPQQVEVSDEFPQNKDPADIARQMCDLLEEEI